MVSLSKKRTGDVIGAAITIIILAFAIVGFLLSSATAIIDNSYVETNPTVLFDEDTSFWQCGGAGNGSIGVSIGPSTMYARNGNLSLQINVTKGRYLYVEVGHSFGQTQDWSTKDYLCFWFYGSNSLDTIEIALAAPDNNNQYFEDFPDNFTGWAHFVYQLDSMRKIGNPDLAKINIIGFFFFNPERTFFVDRLILDAYTPTPTSTPIITPTTTPTPAITNSPTATAPQTTQPTPTLFPPLFPSVPTTSSVGLPEILVLGVVAAAVAVIIFWSVIRRKRNR